LNGFVHSMHFGLVDEASTPSGFRDRFLLILAGQRRHRSGAWQEGRLGADEQLLTMDTNGNTYRNKQL
jgi:hypothetical protein